ncbi:MAG: hypothetical protein Q7R43_04355 [Candidatus Daviesbacteria bacterium]|nr:hypothetical protein [Candidatus Daviesbacteria bacterium]
MRDDTWLLSRLDHLWNNYFSDVPQINPVFIKFGRQAKLRFGSIRMEPWSKKTYIVITGMFKSSKIPAEVIDHTIAHELVHYVHGFSSPHKRMHRFPHEGGVVKGELENRGLIHLLKAYKEWIKIYKIELKEHYYGRRK